MSTDTVSDPGAQIRVLCVESDRSELDRLATELERENGRFLVETAASAATARKRLDDRIDCVVSEYELADTNGVALLGTVRERDPELPYVLFTGSGSESAASDAISAGVSDYVEKDSETEQFGTLSDRIVRLVERARENRRREMQSAHRRQAHTVARIGYWEFDPRSERLYWSPEAQQLFEAESEGPRTYRAFLDYVVPEDRETVEAAWAAALDGAAYDVEYRIVTGTGAVRWVRDRAEFTFDDDGAPTAALGVLRDVTGRKERERELQRFERAIEASSHSVYITDTDGVIEYVNPAFEETTGYAAAEAVGLTPRIVKSGEHDGRFYEELWTTILSGDTWRGELINRTKDGEQYVVNQTIAPVTDDDGEITHFVAINANITEMRRKQDKLHQLRQAVDKAHTPIALTDPEREDNPMVYVNEAFKELCGYTDAELLGQNCRILQGPETDPETIDTLRQAIADEEPVTVEIQNYRKDGTPFWNELTVRPVYDTDGTLVRYLGTQREITERKEREQHLKVLDRVLRHNLRNDMNVIQGFANTIAEEASDPIAARAESIAQRSDQLLNTAEKQRAITDVLLERPTRDPVEVEVLVERVTGMVESEYPDATIDVDCSGGSPVVPSPRIGLAVEELVTNALDHTDQAAPTVSVSVAQDEEAVRIDVADEGPRIPEMERRVSTHAQKVDPVYHGSGLGLWLVHWIVTRADGAVSFEENEPRGNRVRIELPQGPSGGVVSNAAGVSRRAAESGQD